MPHMRQVALLVGLLSVSSLGCSRVSGSAVSHAGEEGHRVTEQQIAQVQVVALTDPEGGEELGVIEASGQPDIKLLVREFRRQAASLGADVAKLDKLESGFHTETRTRQENYSCGTSSSPRTCTRTVHETVEVITTKLVGRAFRLASK